MATANSWAPIGKVRISGEIKNIEYMPFSTQSNFLRNNDSIICFIYKTFVVQVSVVAHGSLVYNLSWLRKYYSTFLFVIVWCVLMLYLINIYHIDLLGVYLILLIFTIRKKTLIKDKFELFERWYPDVLILFLSLCVCNFQFLNYKEIP